MFSPFLMIRAQRSACNPVHSYLSSKEFSADIIDPLSALAILHHDHEKELPIFRHILSSPAFYIGALGSRKTQERRRSTMLEEGFEGKFIDKIHGPIGIPMASKSPPTIAISILAEILMEKSRAQIR